MAEPNIDATPIGHVSQKIRLMETKIRQNGVASLRSIPFRKTTRLVTIEGGIFPMSLEASRSPSISVLSEAPSDLLNLHQSLLVSRFRHLLCPSPLRLGLRQWPKKKVFQIQAAIRVRVGITTSTTTPTRLSTT